MAIQAKIGRCIKIHLLYNKCLSLSLFDAHREVKSPHYMFFLSFFFFHPLPLFSLAALVHALHVRPSCYYKLLGGLTSLIANTDNGTILTQGLTSAQGEKKIENMRDFLRRHKKSISPNRCFHLFKSNLLINTFLHERIPNRCWINNSRCPFFDSGDYFFGLSPFDGCMRAFEYLCI